MYCPRCGTQVPDDAQFCSACGRSLATTTEPDQSSLAPPVSAAAGMPSVAMPPVARPFGPTIDLAGTEYVLAGFWIRFAGYLVDFVVVFTAQFVLLLIFGIGVVANPDEANSLGNGAVVLIYLLPWSYFWWGNATGQTLGKKAVGIRIVNDNGDAAGWGRGFARLVGTIPSGLALGLGYLWAAWDGKKQTWHDKIASTYVIRL